MAKKGLKTKETAAHSQISAHILIKIQNFTSQTRASAQGLTVMPFMQDLRKLRRYNAHYCKENFLKFGQNLNQPSKFRLNMQALTHTHL